MVSSPRNSPWQTANTCRPTPKLAAQPEARDNPQTTMTHLVRLGGVPLPLRGNSGTNPQGEKDIGLDRVRENGRSRDGRWNVERLEIVRKV